MVNTILALLLVTGAFVIAFSALLIFARLDRRKTSHLRAFSREEKDAIVFIFDNETLLDATPAARALMKNTPRHGTAWTHLASILKPRFPGLSDWVRQLADLGRLEMNSNDGTSKLIAEWHDGVARFTLTSTENLDLRTEIDPHSLKAMSHELDSLRANAEHAPFPLWREDGTGTITWCNGAYLRLADEVSGCDTAAIWPPFKVFSVTQDLEEQLANGLAIRQKRVALRTSDNANEQWFSLDILPLDEKQHLFCATPIDDLVRTEKTLHEFMNTLTKTFASLPIGLVIFDSSRQLALFNPALTDLTNLPAPFLIAKPSITAFFDKLREQRMIPEPKDYKSWRQQVSDLITAAKDGSYEEVWSLPSSQTFRVTGRPHPDGAFALLFEDITAEVSISRRYRAEIETNSSALDALPEAICVISAEGTITLSNTAYANLWGHDPSTTIIESNLNDALKIWQKNSLPNPIWQRILSFSVQHGARENWQEHLTLLDGRTAICSVFPIARGATMIKFTLMKTNESLRPTEVPKQLARA